MRVHRNKKRKLVCFASAMVLAVCFFLPVAGSGCNRIPPPHEICQDLYRHINGWDWPCFAAIIGVGAAYLFGLLAAVACSCELLGRGRILRRIAGIGISILVAYVLAAAYCGIWKKAWDGPIDILKGPRACLLVGLWPVLGVLGWWAANAWRSRYSLDTKLVICQFTGGVMISLWFGFLTLIYDPSEVHCGLRLSAFSSIVLLLYFTSECKLAMGCAWKELPLALVGLEGNRKVRVALGFIWPFGRHSGRTADAPPVSGEPAVQMET